MAGLRPLSQGAESPLAGRRSFPTNGDVENPEERTLARPTQDAAFHRGPLPCKTRTTGPPPATARIPRRPFLTLRTVPSIAVTRSPSSSVPSRGPILPPTSSADARLPDGTRNA